MIAADALRVNVLKMLLVALVGVAVVTGRALAAPTPLVPQSFSLPEDSRRFDGSVAVNVTIDVPSLRLTRPKQIMNLDGLAGWFGVPPAAMAALSGDDKLVFPAVQVDLRDWPTLIYRPGLLMDWSVSVPASVFGTIPMTIIASGPPAWAGRTRAAGCRRLRPHGATACAATGRSFARA